jgi:hypothetical protein
LKNSVLKIPLTNVGIVFHTEMFLFKNTVSGESNVDTLGEEYLGIFER